MDSWGDRPELDRRADEIRREWTKDRGERVSIPLPAFVELVQLVAYGIGGLSMVATHTDEPVGGHVAELVREMESRMDRVRDQIR